MLHHMATILLCYGSHFESKMAAKIQISSDLGKIWFPSRLWCCELISIVWEPCYDPSDHIISCYYITPTDVGWCIAILRFFFTIIRIIMSPRLLSGNVLLFYVSFSLLLHHPDCCRVMCCYSTFLFHYYSYYSFSSTHFCPLDFSEVPWSNFMKPCRNIICHVKLCF